MCLPGQVGVPDYSNALDNSQPKGQECHCEEEKGQARESNGKVLGSSRFGLPSSEP